MSDVKARGRFVWFDLMTRDPEKAPQFYGPVTGWGTMLWQGPMPYTMWTNNDAPLGGVTRLPNDGAPHWLAYIATVNVDETVVQATNLGAQILTEPSDIPTIGRFAVLADPQGALFAAFSPLEAAPGHEGQAQPGEFSWHELATHDQPAAFRFYERLFGWEKSTAIDIGPAGVYQEFGRNGVVLGGMYSKPSSTQRPAWLHYVLVDDVNRAVEAVKRGGGQVVGGPTEVPGGSRVAQCVDPQGAAFAVHARPKT
jgi:predicted enzyme related to lactoylglutathione lyase